MSQQSIDLGLIRNVFLVWMTIQRIDHSFELKCYSNLLTMPVWLSELYETFGVTQSSGAFS